MLYSDVLYYWLLCCWSPPLTQRSCSMTLLTPPASPAPRPLPASESPESAESAGSSPAHWPVTLTIFLITLSWIGARALESFLTELGEMGSSSEELEQNEDTEELELLTLGRCWSSWGSGKMMDWSVMGFLKFNPSQWWIVFVHHTDLLVTGLETTGILWGGGWYISGISGLWGLDFLRVLRGSFFWYLGFRDWGQRCHQTLSDVIHDYFLPCSRPGCRCHRWTLCWATSTSWCCPGRCWRAWGRPWRPCPASPPGPGHPHHCHTEPGHSGGHSAWTAPSPSWFSEDKTLRIAHCTVKSSSHVIHLLGEDGDRCGHEDIAIVRRILDEEFLDSYLIRSHLGLILLQAWRRLQNVLRQEMHIIFYTKYLPIKILLSISISESWRQKEWMGPKKVTSVSTPIKM